MSMDTNKIVRISISASPSPHDPVNNMKSLTFSDSMQFKKNSQMGSPDKRSINIQSEEESVPIVAILIDDKSKSRPVSPSSTPDHLAHSLSKDDKKSRNSSS